jgi:membrane protein YqaA with SNARE-associated domain
LEQVWALFGGAFLAATVVPFSSEVMLTAAYASDPKLWFALWLAASVGNTLGAIVNWAFGRWALAAKDKRWFPFKGQKLDRATRWFQHWGVWSLLLAWMPVVGDVLTFIAGTFKVNIWLFILLVGFGKTSRYGVVVLIAAGVF